MSRGRGLLLPSCLVVAPFAGLAFLPDPIARYPLLLVLLAIATGGWLLAWRAVARPDRARDPSFAPVFLIAVALRIFTLLPEVPLSDDLYRYLWDGRVANSGVNPFLHAPSSDTLVDLRDEEIWPRINHPDVPTIYPPTAQLLFRLLDRFQPTPRAVRATMAAVDLVSVLLLAAVFRRRGRPAALAVVAGWCPLAVLESAGGGHVDALGVALMAGTLYAMESGRNAVAGVALGLSGMVKPVLAFPFPALLATRDSGRARIALLGGAIASLLLVLPYAAAGERLVTGFLTYAESWRFNDAVYSWIIALGPGPRAARGILGLALVATALVIARRARDPFAASGAVILAMLFLSPTVHPWYGLWAVPLLPFLPRVLRPGGVALVALLPVAYAAAWHRAAHGEWSEPAWSRAAVWGPPVILTVVGILRSARRSARGSRPASPGASPGAD